MTFSTRTLLPWLGLLLLLGAAWTAYAPGLSGGFLFDDFVNLDALGATGPIDNWATFWRYITSGTADPTGRPIALLSFLIDARDWPADPAPFLATNLWLHLLNGALLFALLRMLDRTLDGTPARSDLTALLGSGLWLLHPLLVSTTLYAVQREAMLPTTFTLMGLYAYGTGRRHFQDSNGKTGLLQMWLGLSVGTSLALLCKGNGILVPLLAGVLEFTIWRRMPALDARASLTLRRTRMLLLVAPSLLVLAYLCLRLPHLHDDLPGRSWTIAQRLLTEPRVLLEYLQLLAIPRSVSTGLYNDAYIVSTSPLSPITTLPALAAIVILIAAAFRFRKSFPRLSAAGLFFFAGHALESTTIPLELYFEHRNYLPALLLFWPVAHAIVSMKANPILRGLTASFLLILFFATTHARADLWGRPEVMAQLWALQNPNSSRAQATAGMALASAGQVELAASRLAESWKRKPDDLQLALNYIDAACRLRGVSEGEIVALGKTLSRSTGGELLTHQWLGRAIGVAQSGQCTGLELEDVANWIEESAANPKMARTGLMEQTIGPLRAQVAIARQRPDEALTHFNRALLAFPTPDAAARFVAFLASAGYYSQAMSHLDFYDQHKAKVMKPGPGMPRLHAKVLQMQGYWPREMAILRAKLAIEIANQNVRATTKPIGVQ